MLPVTSDMSGPRKWAVRGVWLPQFPLRGSAGCDRVRQDERVDPYLPTREDLSPCFVSDRHAYGREARFTGTSTVFCSCRISSWVRTTSSILLHADVSQRLRRAHREGGCQR